MPAEPWETTMSDTPPNQHDNGKDAAQSKHGEFPNRRGRPRRDASEPYGDLFDRISNEKITIYENGRAIRLSGHQLLARNVVDRGIAGDPESEKILIRIEQPDLAPPALRRTGFIRSPSPRDRPGSG